MFIRLLTLMILSFISINSFSATKLNDPLFGSFDLWKKDFYKIAEIVTEKYPSSVLGKIDQENGYFMDYLFIPAKTEKKNLAVLVSGIHGLEAPAGVLIQHDFLNNCLDTKFNLEKTSVLIVHIVNPFGADKGRRFNGNNVDLNRNCYPHETSVGENFPGLAKKNPEYKKLHPFLTRRTRSLPEILIKALTFGQNNAYKALSGQYEVPTGLYYGGKETQPECRNLQDVVSEYVETHKNVFVADIHTGLGQKGINQIIHSRAKFGSSEDIIQAVRKQKEILSRMFPADECKGICQFGIQKKPNREYELRPVSNTPGGIGATGTFQVWLTKKYKEEVTKRHLISITAEVGTIWGPFALRSVINENVCYQNPSKCSKKRKARLKRKVWHAFNPVKKKKWVRQMHKISNQMCSALTTFSNIN